MRFRTIFLSIALFASTFISGQAWQWMKIQPTITDPLGSFIESYTDYNAEGITLGLSGGGGYMVTKFDANKNILWKRRITFTVSPTIYGRAICFDNSNNIYFLVPAVSKIDTQTVNTPGPYCLMKWSPEGQYLWSKKLDFNALIFGPRMVSSGDRIFVNVYMSDGSPLVYDDSLFNSIAPFEEVNFVAAIDTAGKLQWGKRFFSYGSNIAGRFSVNKSRQLFMEGVAHDHIFMEGTSILNLAVSPFYSYGMLLDGNTGNPRWVKRIIIDSIAPRPSHLTVQHQMLSVVLDNDHSVMYRFAKQDSASFEKRVLSLLYYYDQNGNLVKKDTLGNLDTGYYRIDQLLAGENSNFYTAGLYTKNTPTNIATYTEFDVRKWNNLLQNVVWKKNTEYDLYYPYMGAEHFSYCNKVLSFIMYRSGGSPTGDHYFYYGQDSTTGNLSRGYARIIDSASFIAGHVYFDLNQNGIKDNNEPPAAGILISNQAGDTIYTASRNTGLYEFRVGPGTYTMKPFNVASAYPGYTVIVPATNTAVINSYGTYARNYKFGLRPNSPVTDGQINITSYGAFRPGGLPWYQVKVMNSGFINIAAGTYKVIYDSSRLIYQSSIQAPISHASPVLTYSFGSLTPFQSSENYVNFKVKTSARLNDTIKTNSELILAGDALAVNNKDSVFNIVRTSFDPNMKEVYPFKDARYDSVIAGKQELDYIIHFQNTGNDTAFTVTLLDTLDSKLDLKTFRLVASSHPMNLEWTRPNIAKFQFPAILLPDSNINEPKSHGFVRFRIKPKTNVLLNDIISNNASIYFDYNSPVKTNTINTNFINLVITGVGNIPANTKDLLVRPNPANSTIYFKVRTGNLNEHMALSVYDAGGRIVMTSARQVITNTEQALDLSRLSKGLYYLILRGKKDVFVRPIIIH